ncbi:MAG TPA: CRISPR-associated endonuclease Cas1 [Blastocatellia bacterium]|nr:CRISPR-associated endonuclease Cas1 [Blastocatellia bacterium]
MNQPDQYSQVCDLTTLRMAWMRVEESDGMAGIDGVDLSRYANDLETQLAALSRELSSMIYEPLPVVRFFVTKASGGQRPLCVLAVRDRVAQNAVISIIRPDFEREFEACSYAYRRGRSVKQALAEVERLREKGYVWVVDADITAYFENVDHQLLLGRVRQLVPDPRIVDLISRWIAPKVYDGKQVSEMQKGLPQGAPISPMLANLYLDTFDEQMLSAGQKLIRFADDFLVLCKSKPKAEYALRLTQRALATLNLALNDEKTRITSFTDGFKYLGATFARNLCLIPPPRRGVSRDQAAVQMPPRLPIMRASYSSREPFNPALREGLREAFDEISGDEIPSFFVADSGGRPSGSGELPASESEVVPASESKLRGSSMFVGVESTIERIPVAKDISPLRGEAALPMSATRNIQPPRGCGGPEPPAGGAREKTKDAAPGRSGNTEISDAVTRRRGDTEIRDQETVRPDIPASPLPPVPASPALPVPPSPPLPVPPSPDMPPPSLFTLRTLYLHEHGAILRCEDDHLRVCKDAVELISLPAFKIDQIVLFGNSQITTPAMKFCLQNSIPIILLSGQGKFFGTVESTGNLNVLLQQRQFERASDQRFALDTARRIVSGKILNCRSLLQRRRRDTAGDALKHPIDGLAGIRERLANAATLDEVRGFEGAASALYFQGLEACFQPPLTFEGRTRRPPRDPVNAMLSFGYTLVFYNIYAIARARGLSPYVGSLHALRQGHPALCSDLIEELRAPIVDSLVTSLVSKRVVSPADFYFDGDGCYLTDQARRNFVAHFEKKMNTLLVHPRAAVRTTWRGCIDLQIGHYIQVLRGEVDGYHPFESR